MTFEDALKLMKKGKKIRRNAWGLNVYIQIDMSEKKFIQGTFYRSTPNISLSVTDILDDDWEIVKEPVLDKQEKKYLENLLRPYTKKYEKITIKRVVYMEGILPSVSNYLLSKTAVLTTP